MKHALVRLAIGIAEAFIALTTIAGGVLMLAGSYQNGVLIEAGGRGQFPLEWLVNTPFNDYTIPALILAICVGGSSLIGAVTIFTGREIGVLVSMVSGLIMAGYTVVEVVMLRQGISWIEVIYFGLGLLITGLAVYLWTIEFRGRFRWSSANS